MSTNPVDSQQTQHSTHQQTQRPAPLSAAQIEQYHRDGFLAVEKVYDDATMLRWKTLIAEALGDISRDTATGVHVWMADRFPPALIDGMRDPRVVGMLAQLIGPDVEFLSAKAVFKDGRIRFPSPWHQDTFYWHGSEKLSIWIAVDDATKANGCLRLAPGTHDRVFANRTVSGDNGFDFRIDPKEIEGRPIADMAVPRGSIVIFSDRAVHGSYANESGQDRMSMISTYRNAGVKDESTVWASSMVVSGTSVNG